MAERIDFSNLQSRDPGLYGLLDRFDQEASNARGLNWPLR